MDGRWKMPLAMISALAVAEAGVLLLRPREEVIEPSAVRAQDYFTPEQLERASAFRGPQRALALASVGVEVAVLAGLAARPPATLRRRYRRPVLAAAAAGAALSVGLGAARLPISAVGHRRATAVGLSTQGWRSWGADVAKAWGIGAVFAAGGAAGGVALMRRFPRGWWLAASGTVVAVGVVMTYAGPVVLDPIFNRFTPLPPGATRDDVLELARAAGVDVGEVYEVDASRRTTGANAYVNGLGRTKRVVLYDTLLQGFERDEVRLVVAHELAHVRYRDVPHGLLYLAVVAPAGMLGAAVLARRIAPAPAERPGPDALPALALAILAVSAGVSAISNQLSRRIEARADTYALELTGAPQPFIDFEQRITVRNISEPEPPAWAKVLFGTHPTTLQRIGAAEAFRAAAARAARPTPAGS